MVDADMNMRGACGADLPPDLLHPRPPVFISDLEELTHVPRRCCPKCGESLSDGRPAFILIPVEDAESATS